MDGIGANAVFKAWNKVDTAKQNLVNGVSAYWQTQTPGIGSSTDAVGNVIQSSQAVTHAKTELSVAEMIYNEEQNDWKKMIKLIGTA